MRGVLICGATVAGIMASACYGQSLFDQANFRNMSLGGIHLYGASAFSGYSTSAYPGGLGYIPAGVAQIGGDVNFGGSASVGWQRHRDQTDFSVLYSGTYAGMVRYSDANAYSQTLSIGVTRTFGAKWTVTFSGAGADMTAAQFVYQPSNASVITQVPATFDDLAAAFSIGQFSSGQVASTLTGATQTESPARNLLLGNRFLSYSAQASLSYRPTSRLGFHFGSFAAGGQNRLGGGSAVVATQNYTMPHTIGFNGGMGLTYMVSPRTQLGANLSADHTVNHYQGAYTTTANASIGRKMGMHWFLSAHGGGSISQFTSQTYGTPKTRNIIGGGSLGFQKYRYTLVASYDRSSVDTFGFAVGTSTSLTTAWTWHEPSSRWSVFTSYTQQQVRNTGYASLSGWQASGGIAERLSAQTQMTVQYVYLSDSGTYLGNVNNLAIHSIRVAFSWVPQSVR